MYICAYIYIYIYCAYAYIHSNINGVIPIVVIYLEPRLRKAGRRLSGAVFRAPAGVAARGV